jgi:hypothetical protein
MTSGADCDAEAQVDMSAPTCLQAELLQSPTALQSEANRLHPRESISTKPQNLREHVVLAVLETFPRQDARKRGLKDRDEVWAEYLANSERHDSDMLEACNKNMDVLLIFVSVATLLSSPSKPPSMFESDLGVVSRLVYFLPFLLPSQQALTLSCNQILLLKPTLSSGRFRTS